MRRRLQLVIFMRKFGARGGEVLHFEVDLALWGCEIGAVRQK